MEDFDIIIEGKRFHCTKAYVELDDSIEAKRNGLHET